MKPFTWKGIECLVVPALVAGRCTECMFSDGEGGIDCPHTSEDIQCDVDTSDIILIQPDEKSIADYVAKKLEGA